MKRQRDRENDEDRAVTGYRGCTYHHHYLMTCSPSSSQTLHNKPSMFLKSLYSASLSKDTPYIRLYYVHTFTNCSRISNILSLATQQKVCYTIIQQELKTYSILSLCNIDWHSFIHSHTQRLKVKRYSSRDREQVTSELRGVTHLPYGISDHHTYLSPKL